MKTSLRAILNCILILPLFAGTMSLRAQATAFTYQGRLNASGSPANGIYDLTFQLFNAVANGAGAGPILTNGATVVSNGLFTVTLDFGPGMFTGTNYWVEIGARTNGGAAFTTLIPRQLLTPAPYAISASTASNALSATTLTGAVSSGSLTGNYASPVTIINPANVFGGSFMGDGSGLTNLTGSLGAAVNFTGSLSGDVTGTQGATVVSSVGGQSAANVASGAGAANAATSANAGNTIVSRDGSGSFSAGTVTAASFAGDGANLTGLNANNLTSGTVPLAQLPAAVALLDGTNSFTGTNNYAGVVIATNANNILNGTITGSLAGNASSATSAGMATNFSGALSGDVTGTQGATVVSSVGGQSAANVASGAGAANAATSLNAGNTIVSRDASGSFSAGTVNATSFTGDGANLTGLSANNLSSGTVPLAQLPAAVALLDGTNSFTGTNNYAGVVIATNANNIFTGSLTGDGSGLTNVSAGTLSGTLPSGSLAGFYASPVSIINSSNVFAGSFTGGGAGLTNVNAATLGGLGASNFWMLNGNAGTTPGLQFLGTTDSNALELHVHGARALRLEPNESGPNLIGGYSGNGVAAGNYGATIAGGGAPGVANTINANYATIAGGFNNVVNGFSGTIGGGDDNYIAGDYSTIGGGFDNYSYSGAFSMIGGGQYNALQADYSTIAGGYQNVTYGTYSFIGGGSNNISSGQASTVPGGQNDVASGDFSFAAGSGAQATNQGSFVWADSQYSTNNPLTSTTNDQFSVGAHGGVVFATSGAGITLDGRPVLVGGVGNSFPPNQGSFIGGGQSNSIQANIQDATIAGGSQNTSGGNYSFIAGGANNNINADYATIAGGFDNTSSGFDAPIGGGAYNYISADYATIAGGFNNINSGAFATVGGGEYNSSSGTYATAGGGYGNSSDGANSTVGGGDSNSNSGDHGTIGGGLSNLVVATSRFATIGGGVQNTSSGANSFIGGGSNNLSSGQASTVPGGRNNVASGDFSFAAGSGAHATNQGSFVWADSQTNAAPFTDTTSNQFSVRAQGGVVFATSGAGMTVDGQSVLFGGTANSLTNSQYSFIGGGQSNSIQGSFYSFIGGGQNNGVGADALSATISGGLSNNIESGASGFIGGGTFNTVSGNYATVAGGYGNNNSGQYGTIAGGDFNTNGGDYSTVAGGSQNTSDGNYSFIAGGANNYIYIGADYATIAGGEANLNGGAFATVGGGMFNFSFGNFATVGGGSSNASDGANSTVGGGDSNASSGDYATIAGGRRNAIQNFGSFSAIGGGLSNSIASGIDNSSIGGGLANSISAGASFATVGGGANNSVTGAYGTIPGGSNNVAGNLSFAAGNNAQAVTPGSFVWGDSTGFPTTSLAINSVTMRASGGFRFLSGPGTAIGAQLLPNATAWSVLSDRNVKKNIAPINYQSVLDKLAQVPIDQWNYNWEKDTDVPNLGPMAQDFKAAFFPGRDDKSISTLEYDGVELAAIQGLNQKLEEQAKELKAKDAAIQALEQRLQRLENALTHTPTQQ